MGALPDPTTQEPNTDSVDTFIIGHTYSHTLFCEPNPTPTQRVCNTPPNAMGKVTVTSANAASMSPGFPGTRFRGKTSPKACCKPICTATKSKARRKDDGSVSEMKDIMVSGRHVF